LVGFGRKKVKNYGPNYNPAHIAHIGYTTFSMADGVSLVVGIASAFVTLIQLSETVLEYARKTARANDEKKALLTEIASANVLLNELKGKAGAPEWKKTFESMRRADGPLEMYKSALEAAAEKLQPSKNPFVKVTKRLVWYFKRGEFVEILSKISWSKSEFDTLLNL
jgi:DNA-binding transcriptional regulator YdaS (Cro superfamily)